jgi:hypothetical protein
MKAHPIVLLLGLTALGVVGCEQGPKTGGNAKICADFKTAKAAPIAPGADGAATMDECLKRWAYSLAPSRDDAEVVAAAAKSACGAQLSRWNQQIVGQPGAAEGESASILTGEPTTPLAEHNNFADRRALFYVVQARAGSCATPPFKNGAPEGIG